MGTRKNRLVEAVLTSTHNLCFGAKIRKIGIPCIPQFCYIKVGFKGVYISRTCFPDDIVQFRELNPYPFFFFIFLLILLCTLPVN